MTTYELFWLRELPGGALGGEYGVRTSSLEHLPINETLAGRIRRLSAPGACLSLHFPFLTYRDRHDWPARQLELPVTLNEDKRRIMVGDEADHQFSGLLAAPGIGAANAPLVFQDERTWKAPDWQTVIVPMAAAHGMRLNPAWKPTGRVHVKFALELPAGVADGWSAMPHRRDALFLDHLRGVSTAVQLALRSWLPYLYFADTERYSKPHFAHSYQVYGELPPHPSRRKTQLTFHVLEPQRVIRSMRRLTRPVSYRFRQVQARMSADWIEPHEDYLPENAREIVRTMHSLPRTFAALLSLEAFVVEELVSFASLAYDLRTAEPRARLLTEPSLALLHNLRCRLARSYGGESFVCLANLILVAATAGLIGKKTSHRSLKATITATDLQTGRQIVEQAPFSYAISGSSSH